MAEWREQVVGLLTEIRDLLASNPDNETDDCEYDQSDAEQRRREVRGD